MSHVICAETRVHSNTLPNKGREHWLKKNRLVLSAIVLSLIALGGTMVDLAMTSSAAAPWEWTW